MSQTTVPRSARPIGPNYKWIALSNTTLGMLMATINSSIVLISLPAIFTGVGVNPLAPGETNYLLWMLMGYMIITATLVVTFGRIGDIYGRVKLYNLGFAIFTVGSILLFLTPGSGDSAIIMMILFRLVQGVGAGFLMANSTAILTDAFPAHQRGMALGINQMVAILGSILGLIVGGLLSVVSWRAVFLVSVPFGILGTIWAYLKLRETSTVSTKHQGIDWFGNITFFLGLTILLIGMTYGIEPYGSSAMGWGNPMVIAALVIGALLLVAFVWIEMHVAAPMFQLSLFRIPAFTTGNISGLLSGLARGGLQFILIIWLQGIWLPLHGYNFEDTPLWAGIYMLPLMVGFIIMGPLSGWLSDRFGARIFSAVGMFLQTIGFVLLTLLPTNFAYMPFAFILFVMGVGQGMFASPNTTDIMNSVPASARGAGSGMRSTFQNAATVISMGMFFSIVTAGLAASLPGALYSGLTQAGLPVSVANGVAHLPPVAALFAAFLGFNPMQTMLPPAVLHSLPKANQAHLLGKSFFPNLISGPFVDGLHIAFYIAAAMCLVAGCVSLIRTRRAQLVASEVEHVEVIAPEVEAVAEMAGEQ
ncbi:MFS transporter [Dictyobacter aurantiacus]|uniref:MFS transporter n=1 Tax=Dictyobacter aurantiacus TaxID=1936993 RepID=A0A401ZNU3_9CHLR|nr:MFS transporter [Dictyobacter aurantiacus]GCE08464.1 MFS transporter [Dictyobacter aurantiacus]